MGWHSEDDIADAHHHGFGQSSDGCDGDADQGAYEGADGDSGNCRGERVPCTCHQHGEHVTTEVVGAEAAIDEGRFQLLDDLHLGGRDWSPDQGKQCDCDQEGRDNNPYHEGWAVTDEAHHFAPDRSLGSMKR
ncbi:hypothetical protein QE408_000968 [Agrobacterium larrymoorei]|uniref:Uncharacterized protein n=1 Tax=Agrobacterium larrymoorei TaxID=160699 RepID=A0ABU0UFY4_9HYPH|nr:hypothetical protein [Agrobacterium larrymoorei]